MNAAVRAVARTAFARRWEVVGIEAGYRGLLEGRFRSLGNCGVGSILHPGGTVLGTARSPELRPPKDKDVWPRGWRKLGSRG